MAKPKTRLGRGLDSLIAGGGTSKPAPKKASAKTPPAKKAKKAAAKRPVPKKRAAPAAKQTRVETPKEKGNLREVAISMIVANPHQPRKVFTEKSLSELAESIRSEGLLQPIVVREVGNHFELIAGERRWRACQKLRMKRIPISIIEANDTSSAVMSLIENLQRENLNPLEESEGYARLMSDFGLTQEAVSERLGKARASIANSLRLLQLPREIQQFVSQRILSVGHAKILLGLDQADEQIMVARQIIERQMSVREAERLIQNKRSQSKNPRRRINGLSPSEEAALADVQKRLSQTLKTQVQVKHGAKKGQIVIDYFGNDDLQRVLEQLGVPL
jgi:ParB family chromosome partitioning protein|tara:strand:- start:4944 stop:5942 length:999 start_codon:yes stop_codon:yes gene_type:complete